MKFLESLNLFLIYEEVDFDSKPEFAKGTDLRKKIDEILDAIKKSKYSFKDLDERYADGFIAERVKAFINNKFDSKEIADVLVKFAYLVKFHSKDLLHKNFSLDLRKYPYPKLKQMVEKEYDHWIKIDSAKIETKEKAVKGAELVLETDKFQVYKITTKEASIEKGRNTNWCISADDRVDKEVSNYWDDYKEYDHYFFIDKKGKPAKQFNKIVMSILKSTGTLYDVDGYYEDENNLADDDEFSTTDLLNHFKHEDQKIYDWIVKNFEDDTAKVKKQLFNHIKNGDIDNVKNIIQSHPKIDLRVAFNVACSVGRIEIAKLLFDTGRVDINYQDQYGQTPLMLSIMDNDISTSKFLLAKHNIDINKQNNQGNTALCLATSYKQIEIIKLLLARHDLIDVNSSIFIAAQNNEYKPLEILLKDFRSNINATDKQERTALMFGVSWDNEEAVKVLLSKKDIDINKQNKQGNTAFINACKSSSKDVIILLLEDPRTNTEIKNKDNKTGYELAGTAIRKIIDQYKKLKDLK